MVRTSDWKQYRDFVLRLEPDAEGTYRVDAQAPGGGEAHATVRLPFDEKDVQLFLHRVGHTRRVATRGHVPPPFREAASFGHELFNTIISGEVRVLYSNARHDAQREEHGLRLQLRLSDAPELADLPWEFLYDGDDFLALSNDTPLVRYLDLKNPPRPMEVQPPLRILVTISAPKDLPHLDIDEERAKIKEAVRRLQLRGALHVDFAPDAQVATLLRTLRRARARGTPYHVWHYVGHGTFHPRENASSLLFCDRTGKAREISDLHLGPLFAGYPEMRLVLLNACEAARPHPKDPFAGVAAGLVKRGVPAVIGMQFDISDEAAIILSSEFYQALVDGLPVDAALTQARQAVFFMPNYVEWATPVLFMRAPDGRIFDLTEADLTSTASSARAGDRPRDLTKELEALYTEGLAAYFTERWNIAVERFNRVAQLDPGYRDVVLKLEKATKQNQLAELYTQGSKAFESQSWPDAVESFQAILDMDAGYKDAPERLEEARRHRTISGLYQDAVQLHGAGQYQAVVRVIDQIHQLDPDFVDPEDLLGSAREGLVRQEQQSKVAELQSQALQRMDERDWLGAKEILEEIREVEPDNAQREALLARVENELDPTQHGEIEPIEPEDAEAPDPGTEPGPEPGFSITLSVKPRELQTGEEAKWTATVENDGDTDLFDMIMKQGRKRLGKPFRLAPGEKKQRTFTNSYDTPGQKSKTVSARALDPDGEPVEAKVRLRVEVYEPAEPEPSPPPDQTASLPSGKDEKRGDGMLRGRRTYPRTAADVIGRRQYELPDRTNLLRRSTQDRWMSDLSLARRRRANDTEPDRLVEKIRDLLDETASDYDDFFVDPDIPEKKMTNARSKCEVPWGERILGLVDFTAWGSAKDSLVFGEKGIYYHNGWLSSDRGAGSLRYAKFPKRKFKELFDDDGESWEDVSLGKGQIIDTAASDVPASVLTDLLKRIRKLVKNAKT